MNSLVFYTLLALVVMFASCALIWKTEVNDADARIERVRYVLDNADGLEKAAIGEIKRILKKAK